MKNSISILGCGWLGLPLAEKLVNLGYQVKGSTTTINKFSQLGEKGITPFLLSIDDVNESMDSFLDADILIIAIPSKNIEGFSNLMIAIKSSAIKNIIFISSTSVYRTTNSICYENAPTTSSPLVTIEKMFIKIPTTTSTIVRCGGLIGYNRHPGNFISENKKILQPYGYVNLLHRDDAIEICIQIIKQNYWGEIINACADSHPTRKEFYTKAAFKLGKQNINFENDVPLSYKIVSNEKVKKTLNYSFQVGDLLSYLDTL